MVFCNWVIVDGFVGLIGIVGFKVEVDCYYFYVLYVCLWVYCMLIYWVFKELNGVIGYFVVNWFMGEYGWSFDRDDIGEGGDDFFGLSYFYEIYLKVNL